MGFFRMQTLPTFAMFIDGVMIFKQLGFLGIQRDGSDANEFTTGAFARQFRTGAFAVEDMIEEDFDSEDEFGGA